MACDGNAIGGSPPVKWVCAVATKEKGVGSDYGETHSCLDEFAMSE